ncbi:hypothetical protein [Pseudomonas sp. W4I3]|uniref:hypothetical protein n=1 Tax=Pseudomonas sp. W4I3 TaxID=3042294 RepID=UPI002786F293|nr:hypothetical protein [Pseudomonas sp. W4I3]MDQ0740597.1 hypothetical protein [Pseudomonas sp. W4I3]
MSLVYKELPSVLVQEPRTGYAYIISSQELSAFELTADAFAKIDDGVVTFIIPDDELIETTPPFNVSGTHTPTVIIQALALNKSFLLSYEQLQLFKVSQPNDYGGYGISFVIPSGNEFLEDLSPVQQAMLQSGETGGGYTISHGPALTFPSKGANTPAIK